MPDASTAAATAGDATPAGHDPDDAIQADAAEDGATSDHGTSPDGTGAPTDVKDSFRAALDRKAGRNSHVESHLDGRHIGSGNNDTHKRQFRRKSG